MNRFFRTAYASAYVALITTLVAVISRGAHMPFLSFSCLYFGLVVFLLPEIVRKLGGLEALFGALGTLVALCGFLFLLKKPTLYIISYAICLASAAAFVPLLRHKTTHNDFDGKFRFSLIALGCFIALTMVAGLTEKNVFGINVDHVKQALKDIIPILIVLLSTGVLLLRGLRAQQGIVDERAFNRRQLRDTLIFGAAVTAVFAADPFHYLNVAADFVMDKVIRPLIELIRLGLKKFVELITNPHPPNYGYNEDFLGPASPVNITPPPEMPVETLDPREVTKQSEQFYRTLVTIFMIVAAVLVLTFLIGQLTRLIKKLMNKDKMRGTGYPNEETTDLPPEGGDDREARPSRFSRDPRLRMRYLYREFMHHLKSIQIPIKPSDTCTDINSKAKSTLRCAREETEEFTSLYKPARYRLTKEPERADADRMKKLLGEIRERER